MYDGSLQDLIDELGQLPGVGPKSAQRIAFYLLSRPAEEVTRLSEALVRMKKNVRFCSICGNISEDEQCAICKDSRRHQSELCIVEEAKDVGAIERTRSYRGLYHVLGGTIDPINGVGPDQLRIRELLQRLSDETITEVIIATNPNIEGEATATYLSRTLAGVGIEVTRLASGLPVGGDLEYADEVTLGRAFEGRRAIN
ncbi:MAG: recombination mediator RecR [Actinomycetaceae bacterium]|nr:recombination mediator RecR [Actinomycetaceae bacterium]